MVCNLLQISSIKNPKSLSIDWIGERIYILDAADDRVIVTNLHGNNLTTIVAKAGSQSLDIVCDPYSRRIFWSTLEHGILSASMDGTNKQSLVDRGVEWATDLTIDYPTQRLYWADHRKGTIETILLSGKGRHVVTQFRNRSTSNQPQLTKFLPKHSPHSIFYRCVSCTIYSHDAKAFASIRRLAIHHTV